MKRIDNLYAKYEEAYAKKVRSVADVSTIQSPKYSKIQFSQIYKATRTKYIEAGGNVINAARNVVSQMVSKQIYGRTWSKSQIKKAQEIFTDEKGKLRTAKYIKENIADLVKEKALEYDELRDLGLEADLTLSEYIGREVFGSN